MKIKFKSKPSEVGVLTGKRKTENVKMESHAKKSTTERVSVEAPKQFRSKSLKNAVKMTESINIADAVQKK